MLLAQKGRLIANLFAVKVKSEIDIDRNRVSLERRLELNPCIITSVGVFGFTES